MLRRDVEADILGRLNTFIQGGGRLAATSDGKVNVLALCRDLGLNPADAQHFHRKDGLKSAVNGIAASQDLLSIGARGRPLDKMEETLEKRLVRVQAAARSDAVAAAETSAAMSALAEQLRAAQAEMEVLRIRNRALAERLRLVEEQGLTFDGGDE